jgi:hypothetical protein
MSDVSFTDVRDLAVMLGRAALVLSLEDLDAAIASADHALAVGPILDPTLSIRASGSLEQQVAFLRAFRKFRAAMEEFRPVEASS